jgi:16S rRNA (guanine(966)-N(2))-methyltransferase RsmD
MRVITGRFKGRRLASVADLSVRPATDRAKKTIFDLLMTRLDIEGATVLDLFAGTGSLGIEALSRGAQTAVFVESDRRAAAVIRRNLLDLGCADEAEIVETDAAGFLRRDRGSYGLIFADPPYAYTRTAALPELIMDAHLLAPGGILIIEHAAGLEFPELRGCPRGPVKKFGRTVVSFFRNTPAPGGEEQS